MRAWLTSWRFLVSRRWILFFLAVVVLAYGTWWLGEWQFGRLHDRRKENAVIEANEKHDPAPVAEVLAPGEEVSASEEYKVVEATGTYDVADSLIVRYRTREGEPGVDVVVPLVTADGTALIVDRGWTATDDPHFDAVTDAPAPPSGEVTITGWVRVDGEGSSTTVSDGGMRAISSKEIGDALGQQVYGGFVELLSEDPEPEHQLLAPEAPDLGEGPHFFYGLQWWFFGVLAVGGFGYLAYDERKHGPRGQRPRAGDHDATGPAS